MTLSAKSIEYAREHCQCGAPVNAMGRDNSGGVHPGKACKRHGEHTPGPWEISKHATTDYAPQYGVYAGDSPRDHCIVTGENAEADARLIAAAPELLKVCQAALVEFDPHTSSSKPCQSLAAELRSAIAKAVQS